MQAKKVWLKASVFLVFGIAGPQVLRLTALGVFSSAKEGLECAGKEEKVGVNDLHGVWLGCLFLVVGF